MDNSVLL